MIRIEGGGVGFLAGVGETDLILLAMNEEAVKQLMQSGVKIGVDVMAAAGPVGRNSEADTTPIPASGLLSYSRARGVFAGVAVGGTTLRSDDHDNALLYRRRVDESEILSGKVDPTTEADPLLSVLRGYPKRARP
jgi:lipid-binding SYLF domain-containing protein